MTETNDYSKEEKRSFKDYETSDLRKMLDKPNEWLAHKAGFCDGYQLGKSHAAKEASEPIETSILEVPEPQFIPFVRLRIAAMALPECINMAGRCGNQYQRAAQLAVNYADALLNELNKKNNDTDSNK
ncbi:MAG: hypothetical protein K2J12_10885 [Muribaculaceae bacterium]|nr:hypothetical protein [Muribaculaceae bacterium]